VRKGAAIVFWCSALAGCNRETDALVVPPPDIAVASPTVDLAVSGDVDGGSVNACGDVSGMCQEFWLGPDHGKPFPLDGDQPNDPEEQDSGGLARDQNGWLGLSPTTANLGFLWLANTADWSRGTVSKLDALKVREVARYPSVTCSSWKSGNKLACDGKSGCCARDSYPQFQARLGKQPTPPWQQVQIMANDPSRTAVDWNGDAWIANRAFGGQSSVTKIANDPGDCIDRNGNGKIDTSRDANGDGIIQTDCNDNGVPDDLDDVKSKPCKSGFPEEYFGLDDECLLFTTNTNVADAWGRPLGLGPGKNALGPSDAWAGTFSDGKFFRIDGENGLTLDQTQVQTQPYGVAIDGDGIAWAGPNGPGKACYFDTNNPQQSACIRDPQGGPISGYGVTLDRDQNLWWAGFASGNVYRYTPRRGGSFSDLGMGYWTTVTHPGSDLIGANNIDRYWGIAADARNAQAYFVWVNADQWIVRIPASAIPVPNGMDSVVDGMTWPVISIAGSGGRGVGVDNHQNIWAVSITGSVATRIPVDGNGTPAMPDIVSPPQGNEKCPAGDRCAYSDNDYSLPSPYTYSDFTGFGLRNFTRPAGSYEYVVKGCDDGTKWVRVDFIAEVPANTTLAVRARSGNTPFPDGTWGKWTDYTAVTPADLLGKLSLSPNLAADGWLQVDVALGTQAKNVTPKLKDLGVLFECMAPR
jgi:hypothetical protein